MNTVDKLTTFYHLQHIAEIHVEGLQIDIRSHVVRNAVVVVLLIDVEQLLILRRYDDEVVLTQLLIELLVEIIEHKHIDSHRRIEQFQTVAIHLTTFLHLGHTSINLIDKCLLCIRQLHLTDIGQRFPVMCLTILEATIEIPVAFR